MFGGQTCYRTPTGGGIKVLWFHYRGSKVLPSPYRGSKVQSYPYRGSKVLSCPYRGQKCYRTPTVARLIHTYHISPALCCPTHSRVTSVVQRDDCKRRGQHQPHVKHPVGLWYDTMKYRDSPARGCTIYIYTLAA